MRKNVLLFSGGIDSFVAYHFLVANKIDPVVVYFDLGAPYNQREIEVIKKLIPETVVDKSITIGETQRGQNAFIPYRNLILAASAAKYGKIIWIAGLKDDCVEDKNPQAFETMQYCLNSISKPEDEVKILSPFWEHTKKQVVELWLELSKRRGINKDRILETISCYDENEATNYCGQCPSCIRKFFALRNCGFKIEFYNQELFNDYIERAKFGKYDQDRNSGILALDGYKCKKVVCVDIDGVLTKETIGHDYASRTPNEFNIAKIQKLHEGGNKITLHTARMGIGDDELVTKAWLDKNHVPYDSIIFGKPKAHFYIDDRFIKIEEV